MSQRVASVAVQVFAVVVALAVLFNGRLPSAQAQDTSAGPRLGRYTVTFFIGALRSPTFYAYLDLLPNHKYKVYGGSEKLIGEGTYAIDEKGNVKWLTGKYKDEGFGGSFQIDGTRHQIHMKDRLYARNQPEEKK